MSRQISPTIEDGNLVIGDTQIAPSSEVESFDEVGSGGGGTTYRVVETDGSEYDVRVVGGDTAEVDYSQVYTKTEVDAKIAEVNQGFNNIRFDTATGEIVFENV